MAELADAPDLGSGGDPVQVQVLLSAVPKVAVLSRFFYFMTKSVTNYKISSVRIQS